MKRRIKFDSAILSFLIIVTGFLYLNKKFFLITPFFDNALDFLGFLVILKGIFLRMAARGHKKAHSGQGGRLVMTGPYAVVRNPMYLGSFLMGAGFILMLWPWWSLPFFALLFYLRFNRQIIKEESRLSEFFGEGFAVYCKKTPRLFPSLRFMKATKVKDILNLKEAFSTKERRGLLAWPALAIGLETFQESVVFGGTDIRRTLCLFLAAALVFAISFWFFDRYG
ncbi:MAG: hypothetical protein A3D87_08830 [Omnitrophica WOR_2 bacterium RIFCSPHIGHO2_02_FULL_50_17]|nr:MAG: hypothetical protein A3D87_08830 [Omnitrophica WOR_2 bacterium RIFCSPHIGHO2_02_FULL_50_17]